MKKIAFVLLLMGFSFLSLGFVMAVSATPEQAHLSDIRFSNLDALTCLTCHEDVHPTTDWHVSVYTVELEPLGAELPIDWDSKTVNEIHLCRSCHPDWQVIHIETLSDEEWPMSLATGE